jgi:hypothetical protein
MPNELSQPDPGLLEYRRPVPQKTKHLLLNAAAQEGWRCTYCKQVLDLSRETEKIKDNKQMKEHTFDNRRILVATMCDNSSFQKKNNVRQIRKMTAQVYQYHNMGPGQKEEESGDSTTIL